MRINSEMSFPRDIVINVDLSVKDTFGLGRRMPFLFHACDVFRLQKHYAQIILSFLITIPDIIPAILSNLGLPGTAYSS